MRTISRIVALVSAVALSFNVSAQTLDTLTLQGDYVKIGTNKAGTIGSGGNTPPGIQYDNTGTGTFNSAYDYLTPGAPFEGWTVKFTSEAGGIVSTTNNNMNINTPAVTGVLENKSGVEYKGTTYDQRAVWKGANSNFEIEHDVRFNNNQKFVDITTTLKALVPMTNLYFGRFTDPDARAAAGDSSATTNTLGFSPIPATQVVFSEALVSKYALGLYSAATNVGAGISSMWTTDPQQYKEGVNGGNGDYTIGLGFYVPTLNVGDTVEFKYAYIFGPSTLDAGATAVNAGVGGGTPGVIPGCVTDCTMEGVTPTTPPTPEPPPVTETGRTTTNTVVTVTTRGEMHEDVRYTDREVKFVNERRATITQTWRHTTVTRDTPITRVETTTPVTVITYSDGTSSTVVAPDVVVTSVAHEVLVTEVDNKIKESVEWFKYKSMGFAGIAGDIASALDSKRPANGGDGLWLALDLMNDGVMTKAFTQMTGTVVPNTAATMSQFNTSTDPNPQFRVVNRDGAFMPVGVNAQKDKWAFAEAWASRGKTYGLNTESYGLTGGIETLTYNRDVMLGMHFSVAKTDMKDNLEAQSQAQSFKLGVHGMYAYNDWTFRGVASGSYSDIKFNRPIIGLGLAQGQTNGYGMTADFRVYAPSPLDWVQPFAGVTVNSFQLQGFNEQGSLAALGWQSSQQITVPVYAGLRFYKPVEMYSLFFNLEPRVIYSKETNYKSIANIGDTGASFTSYSATQGGLAVGVNGRVGYQMDKNGKVYIDMSYDKSTDYDVRQLKIGLQRNF